MTPTDAAKILDLPADPTPEQLESRFHELRAKLEDKIAKAPTPGLKTKYRESLDEVTAAFETLTLAADSSSLPVLKREQGERSKENGNPARTKAVTSGPSPSSLPPSPAPGRKSGGGREFLLVAIIALAVLGAGGWFVLKTRTEKAEKARLAAASKAEADRQANDAKAEQERQAAAARLATETERNRVEKAFGQLRGELAEHKVAWEAVEREERNTERRLTELKSDLRGLREAPAGQLAEAQALVAAQQAFYDWLSDTLSRHPAKIARSKAEELLSVRQLDEASAAVTELKLALAELEKQIPERRTELLDLEGELALRTDTDVAWTLTDAFGRKRTGKGPAELTGLAVGSGQLQLSKPHWPVRKELFVIYRSRPAQLAAEYESYSLDLVSSPAGAEVRNSEGTSLGVTPMPLNGLPPGPLALSLHKEGFYDYRLDLTLPTGPNRPVIALKVIPKGLVKPDRWAGPTRVTVESRQVMTGSTNSNSHNAEEWDLTQHDPKIGWQQISRKFLTNTPVNQAYVPTSGSVMRQRRQPDGKWAGEFAQGGLPDSSVNHVWTGMAPSLWLISLGLYDIWPADVVAVGGSWTVKPEVFFPMIGLGHVTGKVEARLASLDRESGSERAVIEFHYSYTISTMTGQAIIKAQVDLTDCYITRIDGQDTISGAYPINSTYSTTLTKR